MIVAPIRGLFMLGRTAFAIAAVAAIPYLLKKNKRLADQLGDGLIKAGEKLKSDEASQPAAAKSAAATAPKPKSSAKAKASGAKAAAKTGVKKKAAARAKSPSKKAGKKAAAPKASE
jgi:hypothetical protein